MWLIYFSVINSILDLHMFLSSPCIFCIIRTEQYLYLVINIANVILGDKSIVTNVVSFVIAASICLAVVVFEYFRVLIWFVLPQRLWWNVKFRCHFFFRYNVCIFRAILLKIVIQHSWICDDLFELVDVFVLSQTNAKV